MTMPYSKFSHRILFGIVLFAVISYTAPQTNQKTSGTESILPEQSIYKTEVVAGGLIAPLGIEIDEQGRIWVAEQGTGHDDGRISVITPDGIVHPVFIGLPSVIEEEQPGSAHHIVVKDNVLWVALGVGFSSPVSALLRLDISDFEPGFMPVLNWKDHVVADVHAFLAENPLKNITGESNLFNLTIGADGRVYMVDSAANAVFCYDPETQRLSVIAELPEVGIMTKEGPAKTQAVPTGIVWQNEVLYVSYFAGWPFREEASGIFRISASAGIEPHTSGLTGAIDLIAGPGNELFALKLAKVTPHITPGTGAIIRIANGQKKVIASGLNLPTGLRQDGYGGYLFASIADGRIYRLTKGAVLASR